MKLDSPLSFNFRIKHPSGKLITYVNLHELCQGCPEVGTLTVNGYNIKKYVFGGPIIYDNQYIYAPCFKKKWFNSGFYLSRINLDNLDVNFFGEMYPIIDLINIENNIVYFYNSLDKKQIVNILLD